MGEEVVIIEDFVGQWALSYFQSILDKGACMVPVKGTMVHMKAHTFFITSNRHPTEWYQGVNPAERDSVLRRLTHKKEFKTPWIKREDGVEYEEPVVEIDLVSDSE